MESTTNSKSSIEYASELKHIAELNSSFDKGILQVAYWGKNRNKSEISKTTFEIEMVILI